MKYLKVFTDFAEKIDLLSDAEVGRLFKSMLEYAANGTESELKGNERFLWSMAKLEIDRQADNYEKMCDTNKRIATNRYESLRKATGKHESCQDKEKDKDKDKDKKDTPPSGGVNARERARFPSPAEEEIFHLQNIWKSNRQCEHTTKSTHKRCSRRATYNLNGINLCNQHAREYMPKEIKGGVFTPPDADEVEAYCRERGNGIDGRRFVDFYTAKGWMVGKNRMTDWKAAVRTWEQRGETDGREKKSGNVFAELVKEGALK